MLLNVLNIYIYRVTLTLTFRFNLTILKLSHLSVSMKCKVGGACVTVSHLCWVPGTGDYPGGIGEPAHSSQLYTLAHHIEPSMVGVNKLKYI